MAITYIVSHDVKDFEIWKKEFDSQETIRKELGITGKAYRKLDSLNTVYVIGKVASKEVFEKMSGDPNMSEIMKSAGIISEPVLTLLKDGIY